MEQERSYKDGKGKAQVGGTSMRPKTYALDEVRLSHSSNETSVMGGERRAEVIQLKLPLSTRKGRKEVVETKSIPITQEMVLSAYKKVRKNKGSAGIDDESLEMFEENLSDNLYITWNRLSSGSYHPSSVREVEIPKDEGRKRKLGIPTVRDRICQQVVKDYLEERFEAEFSEHSYGYRPMKNTHQALTAVRKNVREYAWVIDMDISGFFDNMSHELLMKAVDRHVEEKWVKMYITRWLESPIEDRKQNKRYREGKGTPQGGVISPLLANLFLHYAFDKWFGIKYPHLKFVRYADDIVVHCNRQEEAENVLKSIRERLKECRLELNENKTKVVYCKNAKRKQRFATVRFDFLGFSFQPRPTLNRVDREMFLGYDCAISKKSEKKIVEIIRKTEFHRWTGSDIYRIAEYFNPMISGWINYFGCIGKREMQYVFHIFHRRLIKWACNRFRRFYRSRRQAWNWLMQIAKSQPYLFVHWRHGFTTA
jgi:group II intron reverse transcriptase/maturase